MPYVTDIYQIHDHTMGSLKNVIWISILFKIYLFVVLVAHINVVFVF